MSTADDETLKAAIRKTYGQIASGKTTRGCCSGAGCCRPASSGETTDLGYSEKERDSAPEGADLGLGCGNPQAIAELREGECVLDLGSGPGFDAFLAARQVGPRGFVIGVDMTPEMVARARVNVRTSGLENVEFRLGEIERLPIADATVDAIMSNCVINLSPDKPTVFREAFRVLVPGGRLAIADVVAITEIPQALRVDLQAYAGCVAGAAAVSEVARMLDDAGFEDVIVDLRARHVEDVVASALIRAKKPLANRK
jgi:SAM-dependent methyltransferase